MLWSKSLHLIFSFCQFVNAFLENIYFIFIIPSTPQIGAKYKDIAQRLLFWTGIVGEDLRSTSGLELGARTLLAGAYSLTNGEL